MPSVAVPQHRLFSTSTADVLAAFFLAATLIACGGSEPGGSGTDDLADAADAISDGATDSDSGPNPDGEAPDADTSDGEDPGDVPDAQPDGDAADDGDGQGGGDTDAEPDPDGGDTSDADAVADADAADAGRVFVPGTLPFSDYLGCDENSDCPNGTGNCIRELVLNRENSDGNATVPIGDLIPGLERAGVCSLVCTTGASVCESLEFRLDPTPWTCQLLYADESPYPGEGSSRPPFPFDDQIDPAEMAAGVVYGAICRPPFERTLTFPPDFCATCTESEACLPDSACVSNQPSSPSTRDLGTCMVPCDSGEPCPSGFSCRTPAADELLIAGEADRSYCFPRVGTCSDCLDRDGDGRGIGSCQGTTASTVDCDDTDAEAWYEGMDSVRAFPESCGPDLDANCNGLSDDTEQIGTLAFGSVHCSACDDACSGSAANASSFECVQLGAGVEGTCRARCDDPGAFVDCNGVLEDGCETSVVDPERLYVPDCDGDGAGRLVAETVFDCAGTGGLTIEVDTDGNPDTAPVTCAAVRAVSDGAGGWGTDCDDANAAISPAAAELCDGVDNNCDGEIDPAALFPVGQTCTPPAGVGVGECRARATWVCNAAGGVTCQPGAPREEICDGLDNNCNTFIDDFLSATPVNRLGEACRASDAPGACGAGGLICTGGALRCDAFAVPTTDEPGDDLDADCDGFDGDLERAIFVSQSGGLIGANLGQPSNPVGTLTRASELIWARVGTAFPVEQIFLATGTYEQPHGWDLNGASERLSVMGGYTVGIDGQWTASPSSRSSISFSGVCRCNATASAAADRCSSAVCASPQSVIRVRNNAQLRMRALNLVIPTQAAGFGDIIGLECTVCNLVTLTDVSLEVEGGAPGVSPPAAPAAGANGNNGTRPTSTGPGAGATSTCGAAGGSGSGFVTAPEVCTLSSDAYFFFRGRTGSPGLPTGIGGSGGLPSSLAAASDCVGFLIEFMRPGGTGSTRTLASAAGSAGGAGQASRPLTRTAAGTGGTGAPGGGGGGGAAATRVQGLNTGSYGGGGAAGGCPGNGGNGGQSGGSAIGMLWDDAASRPVMTGFSLTVGPGGAGGAGQAGAAGGLGGQPVRTGTMGGDGGAGGHASGSGGGGGGAGGWSVGIGLYPSIAPGIVPRVGAGGPGGAGGAGGAGGNGPIYADLDESPTLRTAISGQTGNPGQNGGSAAICLLGTTPVSGVPFCR